MDFQELRTIQLRLTNMGGEEFAAILKSATDQFHPDWYIDQKRAEFNQNPVLFTTTRLDQKTGAKFLELCMNSSE